MNIANSSEISFRDRLNIDYKKNHFGMSSQNTIVERASAELTKRINGLRKHNSNSSSINSNSNSIVGKTSVMERVTNVLCGGGSSSINNNTNISTEKRPENG